QGAVRPGAGVADVQAVAAGLGAVSALPVGAAAAVGAQPVAEARLLALEASVSGRVVPLVVPFAFDQLAHGKSPARAVRQMVPAAASLCVHPPCIPPGL